MAIYRLLILVLGVFYLTQVTAQDDRFYVVVKFNDKQSLDHNLSNPNTFLSNRSILRRQNQNISLELNDLPINKDYLNTVLSIPNVNYITKSKWYNYVIIGVDDTSIISKLRIQPFVKEVALLPGNNEKSNSSISKFNEENLIEATSFGSTEYGNAYNQINMLNGLYLHSRNFKGEGMLIGVIDAGFSNSNTMDYFANLRNEGRLISTYDFIDHNPNVYQKSGHGTYVLSTMTAEYTNKFIGTAPDANYLLLISEDNSRENLIEEYYWVAAAEYADSCGADILNTSLGYTTFDDTAQNHTYADLDGNTTIITRASDLAAKKGMLVVNSAGNSGTGKWYYISAPADGDSVLAIGAVDSLRRYAKFSSKGPSADGRTKPNVSAQGLQCYVAGFEGGSFASSGTSFSGPILAGMAACLWQANPTSTNMEILRAIEGSAHMFDTPDDSVGYGIPDFGLAHLILNANSNVEINDGMSIFPNPCSDQIFIFLDQISGDVAELFIYDQTGREVAYEKKSLIDNNVQLLQSSVVTKLNSGLYTIRLRANGREWVEKVIKGE